MYQNYTPYEIKLARKIADTLNDTHSLRMHLQYVRKYTEEYLLSKLDEVMAKPRSEIKRSRGALYVFLVTNDENSGLRTGYQEEEEEIELPDGYPIISKRYGNDNDGY